MKYFEEGSEGFLKIVALKNQLLSNKFKKLPDSLFYKEPVFAIPTVLSFCNPNKLYNNGLIPLLKRMCSFWGESSYFLFPILSNMDIAGSFSELSIPVQSLGFRTEKKLIGEINVDDDLSIIQELLRLPQFDYILGNGYLVFDSSFNWVVLESEDLDTTLIFIFSCIDPDVILYYIKEQYLIDKNHFVEIINLNFDQEDISLMEKNYVSKCIFP